MIKEFKVGKYYRIKDRGIYKVLEVIDSKGSQEVVFAMLVGTGYWIDKSYNTRDYTWASELFLSKATEIKKKDLVLEILKESE
jgi:hypothetical protein